jgi:hypothetical protein
MPGWTLWTLSATGAKESRTPHKSAEKTALLAQNGAKTGAPLTDPDLAALVQLWGTLPEVIKAGILAMMRAAGG